MRCSGLTKAGPRCKRKSLEASEFCSQHQDQAADLGNVEKIFERYDVPPDCKPLLLAYGELSRRRADASALIDRDGLTKCGENGEYPHPAVAIERQTAAELARLHREIVRSSTPIAVKPEKSQLDELAEKRKARRAGPATAKA